MAREYAPDNAAPKSSAREFAPEPTPKSERIDETEMIKEFGRGLSLLMIGKAMISQQMLL